MPSDGRTRKISKSIACPSADKHNPDKGTAKGETADFRTENRLRQHAPQLEQASERETNVNKSGS